MSLGHIFRILLLIHDWEFAKLRSGGIIQNSLTCSLLIFLTTGWYHSFPNLSNIFIIKLSKLHNIIWHHGSSDENIVEQVGATMAIQPRWWLLTGKVSRSCLPVSQTHRVYTLVELLFLRNVIAGLLLTLFFKWYVWMSDSFIRHLCSVSIDLKLIGFLLFDWFR